MQAKYSSNKDMQEAVRTVVQAGWRHEVGGKHGRVWAPDGNFWVGHSLSPSDPYAFRNFIRDIRKVCMKKGLTDPFGPMLEIGPRWAKEQEPKVHEHSASIHQFNEIVEEKPVYKQLDEEAARTIQQLREAGKSGLEVCEILAAQGYRARTGSAYKPTNVSQFFTWRKKKALQDKRDRKEARLASKDQLIDNRGIGQTTPPATGILLDVQEVVTSNLSDHAKTKFLEMLIKQGVQG